jgi:hypothetical protein
MSQIRSKHMGKPKIPKNSDCVSNIYLRNEKVGSFNEILFKSGARTYHEDAGCLKLHHSRAQSIQSGMAGPR